VKKRAKGMGHGAVKKRAKGMEHGAMKKRVEGHMAGAWGGEFRIQEQESGG
jgi:hypothetical protein